MGLKLLASADEASFHASFSLREDIKAANALGLDGEALFEFGASECFVSVKMHPEL